MTNRLISHEGLTSRCSGIEGFMMIPTLYRGECIVFMHAYSCVINY